MALRVQGSPIAGHVYNKKTSTRARRGTTSGSSLFSIAQNHSSVVKAPAQPKYVDRESLDVEASKGIGLEIHDVHAGHRLSFFNSLYLRRFFSP